MTGQSTATAGPSFAFARKEPRPLFVALGVLVLVLAPYLIYSNSLQSPFVADDIDYIQRNIDIQKLSFPEALLELRFLNKLTYKINMAVHGNDLPGYHLVNIALHAAVGVLLFFLLKRLLEQYAPASADSSVACFLAFAGALIFEAPPINTQAVNYTFARSELLCAVFLFSALLVHSKKNIERYSLVRGAAVAFFLMLALASKERAFMFFPCIVLFDLLVRRGEAPPARNRRWLMLAVPIMVVLLLGLVNFFAGFEKQHLGAMGKGRDVPAAFPYFLTEMVVRLHYLKLYVLPTDLSMDYEFTIRDNLGDPGLIAAMAVHAAVLLFAFFVRKKDGRIAFGVFWFFLLILPTSGVVPAALLMHEHWTYIPSFGVLLVVLATLQAFAGALPEKTPWRPAAALVVVLSILCGVFSFRQNEVWQDPTELWLCATRHAPRNARAWNNLGAARIEKGSFKKALAALRKAEKLSEPSSALHYNIAICLIEEGRLERAQARLMRIVGEGHDRPEIMLALGRLYVLMGKHHLALDCYKKAEMNGILSPGLYLEMAAIMLQKGHVKGAHRILNEGKKEFPSHKKILDMLEETEKMRKQAEEAGNKEP